MIELKNDELVFQFPEVHEDAVCRVDFQRTLRIPDDNRDYPLPPGLGRFSVEHVEDHSSRLPAAWVERGGVLLSMYQAEALWIKFSSGSSSRRSINYPFAVKIAAGKINAVTGDEWINVSAPRPPSFPGSLRRDQLLSLETPGQESLEVFGGGRSGQGAQHVA